MFSSALTELIPRLRRVRIQRSTVVALGAVLAGCASQQLVSKSAASPEEPPLGLYEVTDRACEIPQGEPDACNQMQYIELAKHHFAGADTPQTTFVVWKAPGRSASNYTYEASPPRGRFVDADEYVVNESGDAKESLVLHQRSIREYTFVSLRNDTRKELWLRIRLLLKTVSRTPEIDRRLQYVE